MEANHEDSVDANQEDRSGAGTLPDGDTGVGETVEIKIKTLDSQSYTLRVEKNVSVPALKEQLASLVGVPPENQRLICRGKVLKDDHLLSEFNVEDGHTLHLVARQPPSTSGVGPSTVSSEGAQGEAGLPPPGSRPGHVSHSLLMGTINFPDNGEGQMPDLNRIINAVISSIGLHGVSVQGGSGNSNVSASGVLPTPGGVDADGSNGRGDHDNSVRELELQIDALYGMPPNAAENRTGPIRVVQTPVVVPDALTTMSQYLDRLEQSFAAEESARSSNSRDGGPLEVRVATDVRPSGGELQRGASPAALGALVNRVNNLLLSQANTSLSRLASRLESEPTMVNTTDREDLQRTAAYDGNVMQQIGALLLELGRATLSLRMGQSPSDSAVNSGPAIFISPTGPNPMMVQALPLQPGGGLSIGTALPFTPPGGAGFTVRQLLERADLRNPPHGNAAANDASGPPRPYRSNNEDGSNPAPGSVSSGPTGMQAATNSVPSASTESSRHFDQPSRNIPADGGGAADLMNSLAPFLQQIAGALQQSGDPAPVQQQSDSEPQPPPRTNSVERESDAEVVPIQDAQTSRELNNGGSVEPPSETGITSMVTDDGIRDTERPELIVQPTSQGQTVEMGGSENGSGRPVDANLTAPVGLGLGGLQPLARVRRRRQAPQPGQDDQRQAGQDALQNLLAQRDPLAADSNQSTNVPMAPLGNLARAIGGGGQQGGPGILGQFMRSPVMENLVQQVMQGVGDVDVGDGGRRGSTAGGFDISGMLQHMMPVVTQMLGGGSPAAFPGSAAGPSARAPSDGRARAAAQPSETERWQDALTEEEVAAWSETIANDEEIQQSMPPQRPLSDVYRRGTPAAKRQKTAVETTSEKLEDGVSADIVLQDLADAASAEISGNNRTSSMDDVAPPAVRVDGLAEAYLVVLFNDLAARVAADADFGDGSRFPNAARVFHQPSQTGTEPNGE